MSFASENVFKAVSEDEAILACTGSLPSRATGTPSHVPFDPSQFILRDEIIYY
jgi:hypothetical protein